MRLIVILMLAAAEASAAHRVTVCVDRAGDSQIRRGERAASKIFAGIGVEIDWQGEETCHGVAGAVRVSIAEHTPERTFAGAYAYALPYEGSRIVIFYDRVKANVDQVPETALLGYVLAHEIAHILQGICRHSRDGIMKARWNHVDGLSIRLSGLGFNAEDVELIYIGLAAREGGRVGVSTLARADGTGAAGGH